MQQYKNEFWNVLSYQKKAEHIFDLWEQSGLF